MLNNITTIEILDKTEGVSESVQVEQVGENLFKMKDNAVLNHALTLGTEFETNLMGNGQHEMVRITKASEFSTKRFFLNSQFNNAEYRLLGDEIERQGGF